MELVDVVTSLEQLGLVGALLIGAGGVYFLVLRLRNGTNNRGASGDQLVKLLMHRDELFTDMVRHQEGIVASQTRILDELGEHVRQTNRLVEVHLTTEQNMTRLEGIMVGAEAAIKQANELEIARVERARSNR